MLNARLAIIFLAMCVAIGSLIAISPAIAADYIERDMVVIGPDEKIDTDLVVFARELNIQGRVNGDVVAFANTINVTGSVGGDLLALGQDVKIGGEIAGDVRIIASNLELNGSVGRNVTLTAQSATLAAGSRVGNNVIGLTYGQLKTAGQIKGDLTAASPSAELGGSIGGNVILGSVIAMALADDLRVAGDLTYISAREFSISPLAVAGRIKRLDLPSVQLSPAEQFRRGVFDLISVFWLIGSLVTGLVTLQLRPDWVDEYRRRLESRALTNIVIGLVSMIVTPLIVVFLLVTLIGIPIALSLAGVFLAASYFGWIMFATVAGAWIVAALRRDDRQWPAGRGWLLVLGLIVLHLANKAPYLGWVVTLLVWSLSLGVGFRIIAGLLSQRPANSTARTESVSR